MSSEMTFSVKFCFPCIIQYTYIHLLESMQMLTNERMYMLKETFFPFHNCRSAFWLYFFGVVGIVLQDSCDSLVLWLTFALNTVICS